jgi:multicomponent Na+:H+ antiporter subunit G
VTGPVATTLALVLLAGAVVFTGISALGLVRLPDCYSRAHATSKSDTLGTMCALGAAALAFGASRATLTLAALIVFVLLTSPTAAHAIVRSASEQGIEPVTVVDERPEPGRPDEDRRDDDPPGAGDGGEAA